MSSGTAPLEEFADPSAMREWSDVQRRDNKRIVVVPTMGALHDGHLSLIARGRTLADRVIVTIFVNPLQFDRRDDLDAYPRTGAADRAECARAGVDAVYAPSPTVMYRPGFQTHVEPGDLASRLEGPNRPGHFRGVATVVTKLFGATRPDVAVFGRKDFQQLAVIRRMVDDLDLGVDIVGAPTVREPDGLALSSRNRTLSPPDRAAATIIPRSLAAARDAWAAGETSASAVEHLVATMIRTEPRASLEYVRVVDGSTLTDVSTIDTSSVVLVAARFATVRLIDNVEFGCDDTVVSGPVADRD